MSEECLPALVASVTWRSIVTIIIWIIEKQVVSRKHRVIAVGRHLQHLLHVPECLSVFTFEDPGMADDDIRLSALVICSSVFGVFLAFFVIMPIQETIWSGWILGFGIANPCCVCILVWVQLIVARRRRLSRRDLHGALESDSDGGMEGLLRSLWSDEGSLVV